MIIMWWDMITEFILTQYPTSTPTICFLGTCSIEANNSKHCTQSQFAFIDSRKLKLSAVAKGISSIAVIEEERVRILFIFGRQNFFHHTKDQKVCANLEEICCFLKFFLEFYGIQAKGSSWAKCRDAFWKDKTYASW